MAFDSRHNERREAVVAPVRVGLCPCASNGQRLRFRHAAAAQTARGPCAGPSRAGLGALARSGRPPFLSSPSTSSRSPASACSYSCLLRSSWFFCSACSCVDAARLNWGGMLEARRVRVRVRVSASYDHPLHFFFDSKIGPCWGVVEFLPPCEGGGERDWTGGSGAHIMRHHRPPRGPPRAP